MKSNRRLYFADYRDEIAGNGGMMVCEASELIDLGYAVHEMLSIHWERQARKRVAQQPAMVASLLLRRSSA